MFDAIEDGMGERRPTSEPLSARADRQPQRRWSLHAKLGLIAAVGLGAALGAAGAAFVSPIAALVVALIGSVITVVVARAMAESIGRSLLDVGRQMRRFGDGDVSVRMAPATDELGTVARSFNVMADATSERIVSLADSARDAIHLRSVADALEMARDEDDVYRIVEQSVALLTPHNPAQLLVADSPTRFRSAAQHPSAGSPGCPVSNVDDCPAMRRAQTMTFQGPSELNSCPLLAEHEEVCSAVCVPVGVNGHLLGVLHVAGREGDPPKPTTVDQLVSLAGVVGSRIGSIRLLESSRLEASTDGLTGLANRRKFERAAGDLLRDRVPFSLVMADIDHFKRLNDNFGHETGDRALQLFAGVLQDNVRGHDIVARTGGEEFVLVYPNLAPKRTIEVLRRIQIALAAALDRAGLPKFTASFGVTDSSVAETLDDIVRIADAGLIVAKQSGRNRIELADNGLASSVFSREANDAPGEPLIDLSTSPTRSPITSGRDHDHSLSENG